jgi:hypothetical protein
MTINPFSFLYQREYIFRVSYMKQELISLREYLGSPFVGGFELLSFIFSVLCWVYYFFSILCLVSKVAGVSELSIVDSPFGFL